jgi:hypothetical protein
MGFALAIFVICSFQYIIKGRQQENRKEKLLLYGFSLVFMGLAISGIISYLKDFYYEGVFKNNSLVGVINDSNSPIYELVMARQFFLSTFMTLFFFLFEMIVKRTKFVITIFSLSMLIITMIYGFIEPSSQVFYPLNIIGHLLVLIALINLSIDSSLEYQNASMFMLFGFTIITIGGAMGAPEGKEILQIFLISPAVVPIFYMWGSICFIAPTFLTPEMIKKFSSKVLWLALVIIDIIFLIGGTIILINFPSLFLVAFTCYMGFPITIVLFFIFRQQKKEVGIQDREKFIQNDIDKKHDDFLKLFIKPQKITEEEVSVSKEKKICLVCKGKVVRFNSFICECNTIYCQKCVRALAELENVCWVCNAVLEEDKPINLRKEEKELIGFGGNKDKKGKKKPAK